MLCTARCEKQEFCFIGNRIFAGMVFYYLPDFLAYLCATRFTGDNTIDFILQEIFAEEFDMRRFAGAFAPLESDEVSV
jgi:hypothetical protein